jgi:hypothetical protein
VEEAMVVSRVKADGNRKMKREEKNTEKEG